jgi:hypothetical protein
MQLKPSCLINSGGNASKHGRAAKAAVADHFDLSVKPLFAAGIT